MFVKRLTLTVYGIDPDAANQNIINEKKTFFLARLSRSQTFQTDAESILRSFTLRIPEVCLNIDSTEDKKDIFSESWINSVNNN